jgi:uncharacterized alkaline shock family protein YloU
VSASVPSASESGDVGDDVLAERVVAAVTAVPGVVAMHPGRFGEVATHLPGRRVVGVQLRADLVEVHVMLAWEADLLRTADAVRAAAVAAAGRPVDVVVQDVLGPHDSVPVART